MKNEYLQNKRKFEIVGNENFKETKCYYPQEIERNKEKKQKQNKIMIF